MSDPVNDNKPGLTIDFDQLCAEAGVDEDTMMRELAKVVLESDRLLRDAHAAASATGTP